MCLLLTTPPVVRPTHKQSVLAKEVHLQAWWPSWPGTQAWEAGPGLADTMRADPGLVGMT